MLLRRFTYAGPLQRACKLTWRQRLTNKPRETTCGSLRAKGRVTTWPHRDKGNVRQFGMPAAFLFKVEGVCEGQFQVDQNNIW